MNKAEWITGKTVEDILNIPLKDLNKMTESQLRTVVGRLVSAGNKRMRRFLAKKGKLPYRVEGYYSYDKMKFSTVGKDRQELMEEFKRAKAFMKSETTSLKGTKKVEKKVKQSLKKYGVNLSDLSPEDYERFWAVYKVLRERHPDIKYVRGYKYQVFDTIKSVLPGDSTIDLNEIINRMESELQNIYEKASSLSEQGTSRFFEI